MARSRIPNPLDRRHLIEKKATESQSLQIAEAYLAEGRRIEALDFLAKANATERLSELRNAAVEAGDVFLLRAVARAMKQPPTLDEWRSIAATAAKAGRELDASAAQRRLDRGGED